MMWNLTTIIHLPRLLAILVMGCLAGSGDSLPAAEPVAVSGEPAGAASSSVTAGTVTVNVPGGVTAAAAPPAYVWFYQPYQSTQQDEVEARRKLLQLKQSMLRFQMSQAHERRERLRARLATRLEHYRLAQERIRRDREMLRMQYASQVDPLSGTLRLPELMQQQYPRQVARISDLMQAHAAGQGGIGTRNHRELSDCCDELSLRLKTDLRRGTLPAEEYRHYHKLVKVIELQAHATPLQWTLSEN